MTGPPTLTTVKYLRGPDLGNGGRPNSMKLGQDIDLDVLLQKHSLFHFVNGCLQFSGEGVPFRGPKSPKNTCLRVNFQVTLK